jgi:hypothetical protein
MKRGRLAGAVRADQADELARADRERQAAYSDRLRTAATAP